MQSTHPSIHNESEALKRYWTITNNGLVFGSYTASFNYLSADFNTNFFEHPDEAFMDARNFRNTVTTE